MFDRLQQMEDRYIELGDQMALPEVQNDREAIHKASKAHRDLESTVEKFREYKELARGVEEAKAMAADLRTQLSCLIFYWMIVRRIGRRYSVGGGSR